jgi:hypothetical protein
VSRVCLRDTGGSDILAEEVAEVVLHVESSAVRTARTCVGAIDEGIGLYRIWELMSILNVFQIVRVWIYLGSTNDGAIEVS